MIVLVDNSPLIDDDDDDDDESENKASVVDFFK
jgi:hypothetical protein